MTSADALVADLGRRIPELADLLRAHVADNGTLLLHIYLWDVRNAVLASYRTEAPTETPTETLTDSGTEAAWRAVLDCLDDLYPGVDSYVKGAIDTSFLESLPFPGEPEHGIVGQLGAALTTAFRRVRPAG